jgi:hypothetical protein
LTRKKRFESFRRIKASVSDPQIAFIKRRAAYGFWRDWHARIAYIPNQRAGRGRRRKRGALQIPFALENKAAADNAHF